MLSNPVHTKSPPKGRPIAEGGFETLKPLKVGVFNDIREINLEGKPGSSSHL